MIEGSECKCGFKTLSSNPTCPRCGRPMAHRKFFDEGKVLSFVSLGVNPQDFDKPMNLAMVEIDNGPKLVCWADDQMKDEQRIKVYIEQGLLRCKSP